LALRRKRDRPAQKGTRCSAEAKISELFQQIRKGQEIIILGNAYELAQVIPNKQSNALRIHGINEGKIIFVPNKNSLPKNVLKMFGFLYLALA
jgi:antitoxin (DNA-binding transcriptional repressor) of toxin-antitoxin stability system